jgi:hypothetical protein
MDYFVQAKCPVDAPFGTICQEAVANFTMEVSAGENADDALMNAQDGVDAGIADGDLQALLGPTSVIQVEKGPFIENRPSLAPSSAPSTEAPAVSMQPSVLTTTLPTANVERSSTTLSTGAIAGIAAGGGVLLLILIGALCVYYQRGKVPPRRMPSKRSLEGSNQYLSPVDYGVSAMAPGGDIMRENSSQRNITKSQTSQQGRRASANVQPAAAGSTAVGVDNSEDYSSESDSQ